MPHATARFAFEWKVLEWAQALRGGAGFVALVAPDGSLDVHAGDRRWAGNLLVPHDVKDRLVRDAASWILYDPFEWPEYAWLEWRNVPRAILERLIGSAFGPDDLHDPTGASQASGIPDSHGVMF